MLKQCAVVVFATLISGASIGLPLIAKASPISETMSIKVQYGDLDLKTTAGAKAVLHRIHVAAEEICYDDDVSYDACMRNTVNRAVGRLDSPLVTALNGGDRQVAELRP